jgi:hypothetical protein
LGLEDAIPDHSVFSRARNERFRESDIFPCQFGSLAGPEHGRTIPLGDIAPLFAGSAGVKRLMSRSRRRSLDPLTQDEGETA